MHIVHVHVEGTHMCMLGSTVGTVHVVLQNYSTVFLL